MRGRKKDIIVFAIAMKKNFLNTWVKALWNEKMCVLLKRDLCEKTHMN